MKAVVLTGVRSVEVRDLPDPKIQAPDEVLLRTAVAGLCGSDLHYFISDQVGSEKVVYPAVVGHECSAFVEAVGPAVTKVKPGDRVAVEPAISCGRCDQCRGGRPHTCRTVGFLGHPGEKDGCLAEFFTMPERNLFPLPDGVTLSEAMLAEPLSIALHAIQLGGGHPGRSIGVLGTGPIGLCVVMALKAVGISEIYASDRSDARTQAALRAGALWSSNPDREDIVRAVLDRQPLGLDAVFEVSGDPAAIEQAIELVKPGGTIFQIGIPLAERITYPIARLRRKEIAIRNVRRQNRCLERSLLLIETKHLEVAWLANHEFAIADAPRAFAMAADRTDDVLKASIKF
ncbi:MAG: alcohol dehydrogenase catalytic domain-containing protein [Candidatus Aminicenantes bacterium]|nr:alcohol dehydrogenase catalytic domain-containing protein [Candidatus Aminicenantes bacterium]